MPTFLGQGEKQIAVDPAIAATAGKTINDCQLTYGQQPHDCMCFKVCDRRVGGKLPVPFCMALGFVED